MSSINLYSGIQYINKASLPSHIKIFAAHAERHPWVFADAADCLRDNQGCADRALFLCWPRRAISHAGESDDMSGRDGLAENALVNYKGNIIFYVGEWNDGATFDMSRWLWENKDEWQVDVQMEMPVWPGLHDAFFCLTRKVPSK